MQSNKSYLLNFNKFWLAAKGILVGLEYNNINALSVNEQALFRFI
jgi:hypothetical protein